MARSPTLTAADTEALVYTLLGEAEGEGIDGMRAVASVIVNRTKHGGFASDPVGVVSQPKQFDGGPGTPRYEKVKALYPPGSDEYAQALRVVSSHIAAPNPADATGVNAVFFDTDGKTQQKYAGGTTTRIGRHFFYEQKPGGNAASDVLEATFSGTTSEAWKTAIETQVTRTAQYPLSGTASAYAVETAIGGMNPIYLARASKAQEALAAAGITDAHIWSGYRKPESKVNTKAGSDWSDRSLHGFGLAADWGGIPAYGSADYSAFAKIMKDNGFYNPYPGRADEANHWQIVPDKQIPRGSPLADLRDAWAATGYDINSPLKQSLDAAVASEFDLADIELPGAAMPPLPRRRPTPGQQVADDRAEAIAAAREGARREVMQAIEPGTDAASATRGIPPTAWESSIGPLYDDTGEELVPLEVDRAISATEAELSVTPRIEWGIDPDGREAPVSMQMNQPLPGALLAEARRSLFNAPPEAAGVRVSTTFDRGGSFNRYMLTDLPSEILTGIVRANIPMGANGRGGVGRDALDAVRPEGDIQFQSKIDGRPEVPGSMPAAPFVSDFPARPETPGALPAAPREGFQPTVAVRPEGEIQFMSRVEGKPDAPIGQMPAAPIESIVAGRPDAPVGSMPAADGRRGRGDVGMLVPGNIDLLHRPRVKNADGSISTVRSMSFEEDGVEVLVPTVSNDGRILSDEAAIANYQKTGEFLGKFKNAAAATSYAESLHRQQAALIAQPETIVAGRPDAPIGSMPAADGTPTMQIDAVVGSVAMPRARPATTFDPYVYQIDVPKAAQTVREFIATQGFLAQVFTAGKSDADLVAMMFEQKDAKTGKPMIPDGVVYDKATQTVTTSDRKFAAIIGGLNAGLQPGEIQQIDQFVRPILAQTAGGIRVLGSMAPPEVRPIVVRKTVPTTKLKAMMDSTINAPPETTVKPKPPSMATVKPAWGVSPPAVGLNAPGRTPQPGNPKTVGDAAVRKPTVETWSTMAAAKPVAPVYKIVPAVYKTVPVVPPAGKVASGAYNVTAAQRAAFGGTDAKSAAVVAKAANGTQISAAPAAPAAPQTKRVLVTPERRVAITPKGGVSVREKYVAPAPKRYTAGGRTYVAKNGMLVNEKTGVKYARTVVYGEGGGDYGSSPGQSTAGLKPGDRVYNADTNSWGLKR